MGREISDYAIRASIEARKSGSKYRLGAVLVKKRRIINTGFNDMSRSHPIMRKYKPYGNPPKNLHAEVACCIGLSPEAVKNADLYVVRVLKNGAWAMAKPCKICRKYLTAMGVKNVFYTNFAGLVESERL